MSACQQELHRCHSQEDQVEAAHQHVYQSQPGIYLGLFHCPKIGYILTTGKGQYP